MIFPLINYSRNYNETNPVTLETIYFQIDLNRFKLTLINSELLSSSEISPIKIFN